MFAAGLVSAPLLDHSELQTDKRTEFLPPALHPEPQLSFQWRPGELTLAGHTISAAHERALLDRASELFSGNAVQPEFEPLGVVPDHWPATSKALLALIAGTEAATAHLSTSQISIRAVIDNRSAWQQRLNQFRESLRSDAVVTTDVIFVDSDHDPDALCARAQSRHETGPINFEESSTVFRQSAYPRLDRVVALANACPGSHISITGHTDSSGSEEWNQELSLLRAIAVSEYLAAGGVDKDRLTTTGAGSSDPVADNGTRYGRSLNRRIEISLTNPG